MPLCVCLQQLIGLPADFALPPPAAWLTTDEFGGSTLQHPRATSYKGSGGTDMLLGTTPLTQLRLLQSLKMPSVPETRRELQPWLFVPVNHSRLFQGISLTNASIRTELLNFEFFPSYACTRKNNSRSHFQTSNIQWPLRTPIAPVPTSPLHRVQSA